MIVGFPHHSPPNGGPGTFQTVFMEGLLQRGHSVTYPHEASKPDVVLVVGGTRRLAWLARCKQRRIPIVHRLDGLNWRYRVQNLGWRRSIMPALRNQVLHVIRDGFADYVVYQSEFIRDWWHRECNAAPCAESVVLNATNTSYFRPRRDAVDRSSPSLLVVEGNVQTDAASMLCLESVSSRLIERGVIKETLVCGGLDAQGQELIAHARGVAYLGRVARQEMPGVYNRADLFLSLEINAPCPNSVIEAMASGLPVVGYAMGALPELVGRTGGILAEYGGDPWELDLPDIDALVSAAEQVIARHTEYRRGARERAVEVLNLDRMVDEYIRIFESVALRV